MRKIDAHIHFLGDHPDAVSLLEEMDLKLLNICVAGSSGNTWRTRDAEPYQRLAQEHPERFAWCTSFDVPEGDDPEYVDRMIAGLERDFAAGAVACKVWKNLGMDVRRADGEYLMIDDPLFEPIFDYLARTGKPLLMHIGEPLACWQPLEPGKPHYGYYSKNPQWHMCGRTDVPGHADQVAARDRVVETHPRLRVIGAHLGSLEYDVAEVARRLDRYPNFAVDTSARLADLTFQDSPTVRQFFLDYPDRILYGTDLVIRQSQANLPEEQRRALNERLRRETETYARYFETNGTVSMEGRDVEGLGLPAPVLEKLYIDNARAWYPGL